MEGGAALATAWGRKLRDWAGADPADPNRTYVVKPAAVGLASIPGEFVFIVTGLPQAAVSAFSLLNLVNVSCAAQCKGRHVECDHNLCKASMLL